MSNILASVVELYACVVSHLLFSVAQKFDGTKKYIVTVYVTFSFF